MYEDTRIGVVERVEEKLLAGRGPSMEHMPSQMWVHCNGGELNFPSEISATRLGALSLSRDLIDAFFRDVYPCAPLGFLHQEKFCRAVEASRVPSALLLAVCSMGARYIPTGDDAQAREWIALAKKQSMEEVGNGHMTVSTLGCLVLCFHQELYSGDFGLAWMTSGIAIRYGLSWTVCAAIAHDDRIFQAGFRSPFEYFGAVKSTAIICGYRVPQTTHVGGLPDRHVRRRRFCGVLDRTLVSGADRTTL